MRVALFLLLMGFRLSFAADAEAWKSQVLYFLITDRFAQSPGVEPSGPCRLTGWNNGTWAGITHHLDYIKDLGMTAIWITPIPLQIDGEYFGETGYHGYWAKDWTRVDPHFGTEEDLQTLLKTAKQKDVLMMLDVVANHVGPLGFDFTGVVPFNKPEHYHKCIEGCDQWCSIPQSAYDSVPQNYTLIETCRLQNLPDLNQSVPEVKEELIKWLSTTLDKFPFDGIRVDTVKHVEPDFWRDYTEAAGVFTIGEILNGDTLNIMKYTQGPRPAMKSALNFPMFYKLNNVFAHKQDMRQMVTERERQYQYLGKEVVSTMGNFIDNHDFPRFLTIQPDEQLLRNALTWILMADGIPTIYYGTAAGYKGQGSQGFNRACLWEDGYNEDSLLYKTVQSLAKFRTARQLWKQPEQDLAASADCHIFSRGPDVLVVTTNRGSNSSGSCSVELPKESTLLRNGVSGVYDVLPTAEALGKGLVWYPTTRRLTVSLPDGAPRVLTSTPLKAALLQATTPASNSSTTIGDKSLPGANISSSIGSGTSGAAGASASLLVAAIAGAAMLLLML